MVQPIDLFLAFRPQEEAAAFRDPVVNDRYLGQAARQDFAWLLYASGQNA